MKLAQSLAVYGLLPPQPKAEDTQIAVDLAAGESQSVPYVQRGYQWGDAANTAGRMLHVTPGAWAVDDPPFGQAGQVLRVPEPEWVDPILIRAGGLVGPMPVNGAQPVTWTGDANIGIYTGPNGQTLVVQMGPDGRPQIVGPSP